MKCDFPWNLSEEILAKKKFKDFLTYFHGNLFLSTTMLIYRLRDSTGCNINPSYYQNTTIYIQ